MGTPHGDANSTRLSLDIVDLPLTPFGMCPRGSSRKRHILSNPRVNKLSLKNQKSPHKGASTPNSCSENKENYDVPRSSRNLNLQFSQRLIRDDQSSLHTVFENAEEVDNDENSGESHVGGIWDPDINRPLSILPDRRYIGPELSHFRRNPEPNVTGTNEEPDGSVFPSSKNTDGDISGRRRDRDSIFTDIDEGSFIEFCFGKEEGVRVPEVRAPKHPPLPQLYYTCETQNDTKYSTSTKISSTPVGFRKFVDTIRKQKALQRILEEKNSQVLINSEKCRNFPGDESIITGSADMIRKRRPKGSTRKAINSTMVDRLADQMRSSLLPGFADISTLTVPTETVSSSDSANPTPVASPKCLPPKPSTSKRRTIIIESSDDGNQSDLESSSSHNDVGERRSFLPAKNGLPEILPMIVYKSNQMERNIPGSDVQADAPLAEQEVVSTQEDYHSLISEDVSIVNSLPPVRFAHQGTHEEMLMASHSAPIGGKIAGQGVETDSDSEARSSSGTEEVRDDEIFITAGNNKKGEEEEYDADCEDVNANANPEPEVLRPVTPDNAKSPDVAKWIITSPFKDSSFGTSFLQHSDSSSSIGSPSQLRTNDVENTQMYTEKPFHLQLSKRLEESPNHPLNVTNRRRYVYKPARHISSCSSDSDASEIIVHKRRSGARRILETSDEISSNGEVEEVEDSPRQKTKDTNRDRPVDCSTEEGSLRLCLSEELSKSSVPMEKTVHTIGRDATSPETCNKQQSICSSDECSEADQLLQKSESGLKVIVETDEEQDEIKSPGLDDSLPDIEPLQSNSNGKENNSIAEGNSSEKTSNASSDRQSKTIGLKQIQDELDKIYNSKWRKNQRIVLRDMRSEPKVSGVEKTVPENNTEKRLLRDQRWRPQTQRINSDESEGTDEERKETKKKNHRQNLPKRKNKSKVDETYHPPSESGSDSDSDSFNEYLKSVKKKIAEDRNAKQYSEGKGRSLKSFINDESDDDDDDDDGYHLPSLMDRINKNTNLPHFSRDSKTLGSISEDLKPRRKGPQNKININAKNGTNSKLPELTTSSQITKKKSKNLTKSSSWRDSPCVVLSSDSDSDDVFPLPAEGQTPPVQLPWPLVTPKIKGRTQLVPRTEGPQRQVPKIFTHGQTNNATPTLSFLESLSSNVHTMRCHPEAAPYTKNFKRQKEKLTDKLYNYFNTHVFENKLPAVMNIKWNARMTKTAGFCYYQIDNSKANRRGARIELATKVIDAPERLRDTLIHELCHAAAWVISGYKDGHGPLWRAWAAKAIHTFPELPNISRCHSYSIACKYTYKCNNCGYSIGRHSKSLDTDRKVCGYCYGKFDLIVNSTRKVNSKTSDSAKTPKTPGAFAMFVKENYGSVKKSDKNMKHADVMKVLSAEFGKLKASNT